MAETFKLEIATPNRLLVREPVTGAEIPAANGYVGILPDHAPLLAALGTGELSFTVHGERKALIVSGGFLEVRANHVRVLADRAEKAEEIDAERARHALQRAERHLQDPREKNIDIARALNAVKRAQTRLAASKQR